jgi:hypothetical protein
MPSQEELQEPATSLLIDIVEQEARDGVGRTRNVPPDRPQRPMVTYREDSNFSVSVALATCVHGIWSNEDKTPTSFIVFQCQFHSLRDTYQLRAVRLEWTFTNTEMDKDGQPSNPDISAIGPNIFRSWNINTAEVEDTEELVGSIRDIYFPCFSIKTTLNDSPAYCGSTLSLELALSNMKYFRTKHMLTRIVCRRERLEPILLVSSSD